MMHIIILIAHSLHAVMLQHHFYIHAIGKYGLTISSLPNVYKQHAVLSFVAYIYTSSAKQTN